MPRAHLDGASSTRKEYELTGLQTPAVQVLAPVQDCGQGFPHRPQLSPSEARVLHAPEQHAWPVRHATPQAPQFAVSFDRFLQTPPQSAVPAGQAHLPLWQVLPPLHVTPQAPQFCGSVERFLQIPLHSVVPAGQAQEPLWQVFPPEQTFPHVPQLLGSLGTVHLFAQTMAPVGQLPPPWQVKRPSGPS